jgi:hypothetical protein
MITLLFSIECDKCEKENQYLKEEDTDPRETANHMGWTYENNEDLCPACSGNEESCF